MITSWDTIRRFASDDRIERLEAAAFRLRRLDADVGLDDASPSFLMEPFERPDGVVQYAVTEDTVLQFFLRKGFPPTQAGAEVRAIHSGISMHQIRLRSLLREPHLSIVDCACPIKIVGYLAVDPMSFILLGQMTPEDIRSDIGPYRMGIRRAKRVKEMASRLVADLLEQ